MKPKILITSRSYGKYYPEHIKKLKNIGEVEFAKKPPLKEEDLLRIIDEFDAIIAGMDEITANVIKKGKNLKIIARHGVGVDNVDVKAATEHGIIVSYTPGANTNAVAEHTFALILALVKNIPNLNELGKRGIWAGRRQLNIELQGKVLGIIGLGRIGRTVAKMAKAFNMEVIAYSPHVRKEDANKLGVKLVPLEELLSKSDIISIHTSLTPEKVHMISHEQFKLMKKTAYIVNTARGELIDETALIDALKNGRIAGAALDVLEIEPPSPNNELFKMTNVIITPHCAAYTLEAIKRMGDMVTESVVAALRGERPPYVVNPEVFERENLRIKQIKS